MGAPAHSLIESLRNHGFSKVGSISESPIIEEIYPVEKVSIAIIVVISECQEVFRVFNNIFMTLIELPDFGLNCISHDLFYCLVHLGMLSRASTFLFLASAF